MQWRTADHCAWSSAIFSYFPPNERNIKHWSLNFFLGQATSRCRQYPSIIPGKLLTHLDRWWGFWLSGLLRLQDNAKYLRTKPKKANQPTHSTLTYQPRSEETQKSSGLKEERILETHSNRKGFSEVLSNSGLPCPLWEGKIKRSSHLHSCVYNWAGCWRHPYNHHRQWSHLIKLKSWPWHESPALQTPLTALISATQCKLWNQHQIQTPLPL